MKDLIPEDLYKGQGLWQAIGKDKRGKDVLVGTYIPNGLLRDISSGKCTLTELRVLLVIARMSLGFQRDQTCYLALKDFSELTGCRTSKISPAIKGLKKKGMIFRRAKKGNVHMYSVNLLRYGLPMTHYRISNGRDGMSKGEYCWGNASYLFGNSEESKNYIIVYGKKSYKKEQKLYIKTDIQSHTQTDTSTKKQSPAFESRAFPSATESRDGKEKSITISTKKNPSTRGGESDEDKTIVYQVHSSGEITGVETRGKKVMDGFRGEIELLVSKKDYPAIEKTIVLYQEQLKRIDVSPEWIMKIFENEFAAPYNNPGHINSELMAIFEGLGGRRILVDVWGHEQFLRQKKIYIIR